MTVWKKVEPLPKNETRTIMLKMKTEETSPEKLQQLADTANEHFRQAKEASESFLEHARQCGLALLKAKKTLKRSRKNRFFKDWTGWIRENFDGYSYETAKNYIRIAKDWDDPAFVEARCSDNPIDSINAALKFLRKPRAKKETPKAPTEILDEHKIDKEIDKEEAELCRNKLQSEISRELHNLSDRQVIILWQTRDELWEVLWDELWEKLLPDVNNKLPQPLKYNPTETETDQIAQAS